MIHYFLLTGVLKCLPHVKIHWKIFYLPPFSSHVKDKLLCCPVCDAFSLPFNQLAQFSSASAKGRETAKVFHLH